MEKKRCGWTSSDPLMIEYHDMEWGVPVYDDVKLFEYLVLDAFQAGLSWSIVLKKRGGFRKAFVGFDPVKVSQFNQNDIERLLQDASIIRNRLKIAATVENAKAFLKVKGEFGSFSKYIWSFVDGKPIVNKWKNLSELPAKSRESDKMSADLKKRGFKFVGSTICYAFMQAAGLVNDHVIDCFRYEQVDKRVSQSI